MSGTWTDSLGNPRGPNEPTEDADIYQGKPADAAGGCPIFPGKQVAGKGWCSAWAKKA